MFDPNAAPDPNAPPAAPIPQSGQAVATQQTAPQMPTLAPQQQAQVADVAHHAGIGRAFRSLMGSPVDYRVNPETGQTEQVPSQQSGSQLFRGILAGALMGGAVGSERRTFAQGAATGAGAVQQHTEQQDILKRKQAEDQFKNQQEAAKNKREEAGFETEQTYRKALIAHENAGTLRENQLAKDEDFKYHQGLVDSGKAKMSPYQAAGIPFKFRDVPEQDMTNILKQNPGASTYDWEPTGVKVQLAPDGTPHYQMTYSAVDPTSSVTITPDFIKLMKESDMDKYNPDMFNTLTPGKKLSASEFIALKGQYQTAKNEKDERVKKGLEEGELTARTKEANARAAQAYAEAAKAKLDTNKQGQLTGALDELTKNGGDFSKISPKSQLLIGESLTPLIQANTAAIKDLVSAAAAEGKEPDQSELHDLMDQRDGLLRLSTQAFKKPTPTASALPKPPQPNAPATPEVAAAYLSANGNDPNRAKQAMISAGWGPPQQPGTGPIAPQARYATPGSAAADLLPNTSTSNFPTSPLGPR